MSGAVAAAAVLLAACSPALNWREVRPEGSDAVVMFPCKPQRLARVLLLAGNPVEMHLSSCTAEGVTYALSDAAVDSPVQAGPALRALSAAAANNIGAAADAASAPLAIPGMTPNDAARRWSLQGRGADDKPVREELAVFTRGRRVYQATIVGPAIDTEAAGTFFSSIQLPS